MAPRKKKLKARLSVSFAVCPTCKGPMHLAVDADDVATARCTHTPECSPTSYRVRLPEIDLEILETVS